MKSQNEKFLNGDASRERWQREKLLYFYLDKLERFDRGVTPIKRGYTTCDQAARAGQRPRMPAWIIKEQEEASRERSLSRSSSSSDKKYSISKQHRRKWAGERDGEASLCHWLNIHNQPSRVRRQPVSGIHRLEFDWFETLLFKFDACLRLSCLMKL